eukprot:9842086-Alexandrium_andersonii.AAC.1
MRATYFPRPRVPQRRNFVAGQCAARVLATHKLYISMYGKRRYASVEQSWLRASGRCCFNFVPGHEQLSLPLRFRLRFAENKDRASP